MESFIDNFDKSMKKEVKRKVKTLLIILVPSLLLMSGYFVFNSTILLISGVGIMGSATIIKVTKDFINDIKKYIVINTIILYQKVIPKKKKLLNKF